MTARRSLMGVLGNPSLAYARATLVNTIKAMGDNRKTHALLTAYYFDETLPRGLSLEERRIELQQRMGGSHPKTLKKHEDERIRELATRLINRVGVGPTKATAAEELHYNATVRGRRVSLISLVAKGAEAPQEEKEIYRYESPPNIYPSVPCAILIIPPDINTKKLIMYVIFTELPAPRYIWYQQAPGIQELLHGEPKRTLSLTAMREGGAYTGIIVTNPPNTDMSAIRWMD